MTIHENAADLALQRALERVEHEIRDGVRHGHFEFTVGCEVIGGDRRRVTVRAGKSYQFVIPGRDRN